MKQMIDVLEADGIQLAFGQRRILADVYLRVQTGQVVGLLGRNGSGKSTLLHTLFGARRVPDASVRVNGQRRVPAYREPGLLNYLPQGPLLPGNLTGRAAAHLLNVEAAVALAGFPELLPQLDTRAEALSGGTARLLQVLLLLHATTRFSLFDEPFSGVMPVHIEQLQQEIRRVAPRKGILLTDHRYDQVLAVCNEVYLLHGGRLERLTGDPVTGLRDRGYLVS